MAIDTSPTTQDALSIIVQNYNNGLDASLQLNDVDFVFDTPQINPDTAVSRNTRLTARPTAISGKYGRSYIYYNRISLTAFNDKPVVTKGAMTKLSDVVPLLNQYFGINIVAGDYVDANLPASPGDVGVAIVATSLMFLGTLTFSMVLGPTAGIASA